MATTQHFLKTVFSNINKVATGGEFLYKSENNPPMTHLFTSLYVILILATPPSIDMVPPVQITDKKHLVLETFFVTR